MYDQKESNIDGIKKAVIQNLLSKKTEIESTITNLKEQRRNESQFRSIDSSFEEIDRADNEISAQQYYGLLERKYSELKRVETLVNSVLFSHIATPVFICNDNCQGYSNCLSIR